MENHHLVILTIQRYALDSVQIAKSFHLFASILEPYSERPVDSSNALKHQE